MRRSAIEVWLHFLRNNHPAYTDVEIVKQRLTSLPENNSILDQLRHVDESAVDPSTLNPTPHPRNPAVAEPLEHDFDDDIQDSVVPDLLPDASELELLVREVEQQQARQNGVELPTMRATPISERAASFIISGVFPTLFPTGRADFDLPQSYTVSLVAFTKHILK